MEDYTFNQIHELQNNEWWFGKSRNHIVIDLLMKFSKDFSTSKILDIGCSEGAFLDCLRKLKVNFAAIDINEEALELCRKRGYKKEEVKYGNATDIPFADNTLDIVTALDVVEHIKDDYKVISEMKRVCKPSGLLLFIVPVHQWLWSSNDVAYHHVKRYSRREILKLVKRADLKIEKVSFFMTILFPVFVIATYFKKVFQPRVVKSNVLKPLPGIFNSFLYAIMMVEKKLLLKYNLPFGSSLIVIAKKPEN